MRATVVAVSVQSRSGDRVVLRAVDSLSAYRLVGPDGRVAARAPARGRTDVLMTLQRVGTQWRVVEVVAAQPTIALSAPSTSS
jgi:hypothetical protein